MLFRFLLEEGKSNGVLLEGRLLALTVVIFMLPLGELLIGVYLSNSAMPYVLVMGVMAVPASVFTFMLMRSLYTGGMIGRRRLTETLVSILGESIRLRVKSISPNS